MGHKCLQTEEGIQLKRWNTLDSKTVFNHRLLELELTRRSLPPGEPHEFLVLRSSDWVNVIPVTPDGRVVLIRQFRHGSGEIELEIPGGLVDPGETPLEAGVRELAEETGYRPGEMIPLGWVNPNPALFTNRCHTFLAQDAEPAGPPRPEDTEDIEVLTEPLEALADLAARGAITHSLVLSALALFWLHQNKVRP